VKPEYKTLCGFFIIREPVTMHKTIEKTPRVSPSKYCLVTFQEQFVHA
jgi:hypothetical protein